jgi:hypothetical protein
MDFKPKAEGPNFMVYEKYMHDIKSLPIFEIQLGMIGEPWTICSSVHVQRQASHDPRNGKVWNRIEIALQ